MTPFRTINDHLPRRAMIEGVVGAALANSGLRTQQAACRTLVGAMSFAVGVYLFLYADSVPPAQAYIDVPPHTLGHMCAYSQHIAVLRVEAVHKEKKAIDYRKVDVLKGDWPGEIVRHHVVSADLEPLLKSAKPGMIAVTFFAKTDHHAGYTYLDGCWYVSRHFTIDSKVIRDMGKWQAYWVRAAQLRTFSGKSEQLPAEVAAILEGKEVIVPVMVAEKLADLEAGRGKAQKMRASLKRLDYNTKRDSVD